MKRLVKIVTAGMALAAAAWAASAAGPGPGGSDPEGFRHLFVIMMENRSYESLIHNPNAPWINAAAERYGVAARYYGVSHPSQPNYIAATSGSTHGVADDNDVTMDAQNLVDQMEAAGKSWKDYQQSLSLCDGNKLAGACGGGLYARKHNPFVSYRDVRTNPARMARVVDLSELESDLDGGGAPDFSWISPDQCNDMHGRPGDPKSDPCAYENRERLTSAGDAFLKRWVGKIMASKSWTGNSVIFIVWDESDDADRRGCCGADLGGGRVLTLVIPHSNPAPHRSERGYNHYSLLATIEDGWRLGCLARACGANVLRMSDLVSPPR